MLETKRKILIYANYFYPEMASTSQLYTDLCVELTKEMDVTVICSIPCYTGEIEERYLQHRYYFEEYKGVKIVRVKVPRFNKQNKMSRVKHIVAYFFRSLWATFRVGPQDVVLTCSQPPILGGLLGVAGKWIKRAKMIYNIQDFNPEQIIAVKYSGSTWMIKLLMALDKFSCRRSDLVVVVGQDMALTLQQRFVEKKVPAHTVINNWIDEEEVYPLEKNNERVLAFKKKYGLADKFIIMYSGNIGLFYDFAHLIEVIEKFKDRQDVVFAFVGDGAEKPFLVDYSEKNHLNNVVFIPYQDKTELNYSLNAADVHWCVNAKGIKGVSVPSKIYGILGVGKPVLGVLEQDTEARSIIETTQCGLVCEPCEYNQIEKNIRWFIEQAGSPILEEMGASGYQYLREKFLKNISITRYKEEIRQLFK